MSFPDDLLSAEDEAAADLEKEFLRSVRATVKQVDWDKLERDLTAHMSGEDIVDGLPWEEYDPKKALKNLFEVALEAHGEYIGSVTGGAIFDYVDPNALKWIEEYGAKDVKYISDASKEAIRSIIRNGYEQGITVRDQAKQIREHIGLDPDRSRTLEKYAENLFAKGKPEAEVWRLVEKKAKTLLNARANTIAVNETSEAAGQATYQSTKSAVERGVIDPNLYEGFRIVTADERTCERCAPLSGEARKLPDGTYPSSGSQIPKLHIKCRCVEGLREISKNLEASMPTKTNLKESQYNCHVSFEAKFKEDDEAYYVATIPLIEGIGEVTNWAGEKVKRLRLYENFAPYAHWLLGKPVTSNHERLGPETRKLGQMLDIKPKPEQRKVGATTKFFKKDITGAEAEKIASKKPFDGSIEVCCWWDHTPGSWMNPATGQLENYDVVEVGPYDFDAYSVVGKGVVPVEKGAGFNMESKKPHNHSAPGGADMEIEEMKQAIEEAQKPLMDRIAALEQSKTELQGKLDSMEQKAEADRSARVFEAFQAKLKPGHQEKAKEHFEAYQKDPAAWTLENSGMFIQAGRERQLSGRASTEGGPVGFNLEQERARLKAEGKVI